MTPERRRAGASRWSAHPLSIYVLVLAAILAVTRLSISVFGVQQGGIPPNRFAGRWLLGGLFRWDGGWYWGIASNGYSWAPHSQANVAFFPAYPLLMRAGATVVGDVVLAGMLITVLAACGAIVLFGRWAAAQGLTPLATQTAVLALLLYPYAWFLYGVVYSDALFLVAVLGAFILVERGHLVLAGLVGAVATFDRPTGIAVIVGLTALTLERGGVVWHDPERARGLVARFKVPNRLSLRQVRPAQAGILLSAGGLAGYMWFLSHRFGDALLFVHVQKEWGQQSGWNTLTKSQYVWEVRHFIHPSLVATTTAQALILAVVIVAAPLVGRRFGWGYAAFQLALVALPLWGSNDFQGSGRYMLAVFPLFALIGERLSTVSLAVRRGYLVSSGVALLGMSAAFAHGVYLS